MDLDEDIYPTIMWKIPSNYSYRELDGPKINFMENDWRLAIGKRSIGSSVLIEMTLKKEFALSNDAIRPFKVQTGILFRSRSQRFVQALRWTKILNQDRRCIWSELESNLHVGERGITFLIMIMPVDVWTSLPIFSVDTDNLTDLSFEWFLNLRDDLGKLFNSHKYGDVLLICGGIRFQAHKVILSARSEFFAAMFRSNMKEASENVVELQDMEPATFQEFFRFLYTGEISDLPVDSVHKLYVAADKYLVEGLKIKCAYSVVDSCIKDGEEKPAGQQGEKMEGQELGENDIQDQQLLKKLFSTEEWNALPPHLVHGFMKYMILDKYM